MCSELRAEGLDSIFTAVDISVEAAVETTLEGDAAGGNEGWIFDTGDLVGRIRRVGIQLLGSGSSRISNDDAPLSFLLFSMPIVIGGGWGREGEGGLVCVDGKCVLDGGRDNGYRRLKRRGKPGGDFWLWWVWAE